MTKRRSNTNPAGTRPAELDRWLRSGLAAGLPDDWTEVFARWLEEEGHGSEGRLITNLSPLAPWQLRLLIPDAEVWAVVPPAGTLPPRGPFARRLEEISRWCEAHLSYPFEPPRLLPIRPWRAGDPAPFPEGSWVGMPTVFGRGWVEDPVESLVAIAWKWEDELLYRPEDLDRYVVLGCPGGEPHLAPYSAICKGCARCWRHCRCAPPVIGGTAPRTG